MRFAALLRYFGSSGHNYLGEKLSLKNKISSKYEGAECFIFQGSSPKYIYIRV